MRMILKYASMPAGIKNPLAKTTNQTQASLQSHGVSPFFGTANGKPLQQSRASLEAKIKITFVPPQAESLQILVSEPLGAVWLCTPVF